MPEPRSASRSTRTARAAGSSLEDQLTQLSESPPDRRIEFREPILAHGVVAIPPLIELAARIPDLGPSITAWLEVLAQRDAAARTPVVAALRGFLSSPHAATRRHAAEALVRLGAPPTAAQVRRAAAAGG